VALAHGCTVDQAALGVAAVLGSLIGSFSKWYGLRPLTMSSWRVLDAQHYSLSAENGPLVDVYEVTNECSSVSNHSR
jgi:hypothetical protein